MAHLQDALCRRCASHARKDNPRPVARSHPTSLSDQTLSTFDAQHRDKRFGAEVGSSSGRGGGTSLANRRPSGLPVVRRQLSEKDQQLLRRVMQKSLPAKGKGAVTVIASEGVSEIV